MKVYIIMEHTDGTGSTPKEMVDLILGVFFDQRRAEDFIRGIVSYVSTYEDRKLFFDNGKAFDEEHTIHFELVEKNGI